MKVRVDDEQCKGHGFCCDTAPTVFKLNSWGYADVLVDVVPDDVVDAVRLAMRRCPEKAITEI